MRTLSRNKQRLKYALLIGEAPVYERDSEGNIKYTEADGERIPVETGEVELRYSLPVDFKANVTMSGSRTTAKEFGIDTSSYDAMAITDRDEFPITETSLIWFKNNVGYKDKDHYIVDSETADYRVIKVSDSLNQTNFILKKRNN